MYKKKGVITDPDAAIPVRVSESPLTAYLRKRKMFRFFTSLHRSVFLTAKRFNTLFFQMFSTTITTFSTAKVVLMWGKKPPPGLL